MRQMNFYQGSIPPNFISFCLENQTSDETQVPANLSLDNPVETVVSAPHTSVLTQSQETKGSTDSEVDVTTFADEMVDMMEKAQTTIARSPDDTATVTSTGADDRTQERTETLVQELVRTSTPMLPDEEVLTQCNLSALESALRVATSSNSQLPELVAVVASPPNEETLTRAQSGDDNESSVYEVPALPVEKPKVLYLTDFSGSEQTADESSLAGCPPLYGTNPLEIESGAEAGGETGINPSHSVLSDQDGVPRRQQVDRLPELSGRTRAILKTYFDDAQPFSLPLGHPTVAFTEPQMYHLLRSLTDETIRMSYTTMERMVLDAVKGTPTVAPSRTSHFQTRVRAPTPFGCSESSDDETDNLTGACPLAGSSSGAEGTDTSAGFEDSDSSGEMALITETFKKNLTTDLGPNPSQQSGSQSQQEEPGQSGFSSQDATLLEVRDEALERKSRTTTKTQRQKRIKRTTHRGVPMREEFFAKIGWTRSFISGPADPIHNPLMVWCHICKRNFSIRSKGTMEILRHHRSERHLRKDQRWRYEYLKSVDPVTKQVQHRVRGRNGRLLNKIELARELPRFIHSELVDIGERFPFYDDFIQGRTTAIVTPESRSRTQLGIVIDFLKDQGDFAMLRNLWARLSSFTDYQATLCDFDWGEERMTVSFLFSLLVG